MRLHSRLSFLAAVRCRSARASLATTLLVLAVVAAPPFGGVGAARAADVYTLNLSQPPPTIQRGHLDLGGRGPGGATWEVNSVALERNGRPYVPIIGEFHYCRTPADRWEQELRKIKAGGINTVASYVFWNLHERTPGKFDWSGDLDLRRFVQLAGEVGLDVIVRAGPFAHGEMRNGGLPDWLYGRALEVRSNDPNYLGLVEKLYGAIAEQLKGLLFKDGGPVIGVQLENEFQHSAAPWEMRYTGAPKEWTTAERDVEVTHGGVSVSEIENRHANYGRDHMRNLKLIARKHGLEVPLYTATGWGNAAIVPDGSIPVTGAYAYPFWTETAVPSRFYLFTDLQRKPDYLPVSYEPARYPSVSAELGAGIEPIYARRPLVPDESIEPLVMRMLGSGSNGLGYYMYHGGANPVFGHFTNEDASGLPKINYDYQAPLGQYGRPKSHYRSLRLVHLFLASYGERLAITRPLLPSGSDQLEPTDTSRLRFAARAANGSGFVFLLNFQDHAAMPAREHLQLRLNDGRRVVTIPSRGEFSLPAGGCAILPVNLELGRAALRSATVQPLTILRAGGVTRHVFFSIDGLPPELVFDRGAVTATENCRVESRDGATVVTAAPNQSFSFIVEGSPVLVVPRALALQATELPAGRLVFADAVVLAKGAELTLLSDGAAEVDVLAYPELVGPPEIKGAKIEAARAPGAGLSAFRVRFAPRTFSASLRQLTSKRTTLRLTEELGELNEMYLRVNYVGDTGMAFLDGELIDDHFYFGRPWEIGLRRFLGRMREHDLVFVFQPMVREPSYLRDLAANDRPTFAPDEKTRLEVRGIEFIPEYRAVLRWPSAPEKP